MFASEDKKRLRVFNANMRKAQKLQETEEGTATYGATQFADLTGGVGAGRPSLLTSQRWGGGWEEGGGDLPRDPSY